MYICKRNSKKNEGRENSAAGQSSMCIVGRATVASPVWPSLMLSSRLYGVVAAARWSIHLGASEQEREKERERERPGD